MRGSVAKRLRKALREHEGWGPTEYKKGASGRIVNVPSGRLGADGNEIIYPFKNPDQVVLTDGSGRSYYQWLKRSGLYDAYL